MGHKYFDGKVENKNYCDELSNKFIEEIENLDSLVSEKMDNLEINLALEDIFNVLRASNKYIDETTPWILAKNEEDKDKLETVIYNLLESIRVCALLLRPYLPDTSLNILSQLNSTNEELEFVKNNKYSLNQPEILFKRIDVK